MYSLVVPHPRGEKGMRKFNRLFRRLKPPRADTTRHDLLEILFIALAATLAGATACTDFEQFALARKDVLRRFFDLEHGVPSHDTFSTGLRAFDPHGLEAGLRKFAHGFGGTRVGKLDRKTLRW